MLAVQARGRAAAAVGDGGPARGTVVKDTATVAANGTLTQQSSTPIGQAGNVSVQATVTSVENGTVTITVNGQPLTLPLPAGLTLPATIVGSQVTLSVNLGGGTPRRPRRRRPGHQRRERRQQRPKRRQQRRQRKQRQTRAVMAVAATRSLGQ
jgi:hypothetical protein